MNITSLIVVSVVTIPSLLAMGIARLLGASRWYEYLAASILGGVCTGLFFASVTSAMATAISAGTARWKGAGIGALYGIAIWLVVSAVVMLFAKMRQ